MTRRAGDRIAVNRAPVLTLWAAVVAERLGFDRDEALTLGRAVAGLNAQSKGQRLGLFAPGEARHHGRAAKPGEGLHVMLLHRAVPARRTSEGIRALAGGRPTSPESVERYLEARFGDRLENARRAMAELAASVPKRELEEQGLEMYERFRPAVPSGAAGWGAKGVLDLAQVRALAQRS
jgi:hypothetical protein